ncbi:hypothetical protein RHGRI_025739 [Rhododendron griersonianum]|uniref:Uncharacterized protein n=1 Tax=Rhododendron griersonianum TaxID=479676 RepID=A0AAV6IR30_9ERIC|nr:hypothetical protein RHGRI_025739 [Rhododendron griersonianum]
MPNHSRNMSSSIRVLWTDECEMEFPKGPWSVAKEIGGLNSYQENEKSEFACSSRPGVTGVRWALEEVDAEPTGRLFLTVVGPVLMLDACSVLSGQF